MDRVHEAASNSTTLRELLNALHEPFADQLLDENCLPEQFRSLALEGYDDRGNMGDDIAQWLLYREPKGLCLFSLVIPPDQSTPIHDHQAPGLVGLHQGSQKETFYRRTREGPEGRANLKQVEVRELEPGEYYELLPPEDDIHSVQTHSGSNSVSIHLFFGKDPGCMVRRAYDLETHSVRKFQSGYTNVSC